MNYRTTPPPMWLKNLCITIIFCGSILLCSQCNKFVKLNKETFERSHSWNILFKPGINSPMRTNSMEAIKNVITGYYDSLNNNGYDFHLDTFDVNFCPCDTLLYNLYTTCIDGSGESVSSPVPPPGGLGGKGDLTNTLYISNNNNIKEDAGQDDSAKIQHDPIHLNPSATIHPTYVLGILDTGIDPSLFPGSAKGLIWTDSARNTIYNFLPGQDINDMFDDHLHKHGSAVTALALEAMRNTATYPRIMVLKALDNKKKGSIFSVSCALSYARQHNATVINASLGYYSKGPVDSVLRHYIKLCGKRGDTSAIRIFAAAGNTDQPHINICATGTNNNELTSSNLFYPACLATDFTNVISVTGLRLNNASCYYQNYSKKYVCLGVLKSDANCCGFNISFSNRPYEGSSFSTPAACGTMMRFILEKGLNTQDMLVKWNTEVKRATGFVPVTLKGQYIIY